MEKEKPHFIEEKRPRVNANLDAPMSRDKNDPTVKLDNFMKVDKKKESEIFSK